MTAKSRSKSQNRPIRGGGRRRKKKTKSKAVDPVAFWGDPEKLPKGDATQVTISTYPPAVVKSLGRPPLSGHQNASEHYFSAVYERAVNLGAALAAAGNLIAPDELHAEAPLKSGERRQT